MSIAEGDVLAELCAALADAGPPRDTTFGSSRVGRELRVVTGE